MKILTFSDLHLEFGSKLRAPIDSDADLMILAGDIIVCSDFKPLRKFLEGWTKPVIYIAGNHEHYNMSSHADNLSLLYWNGQPSVLDKASWEFLGEADFCTRIEGVNFFGGTMWTDFNKGNPLDMLRAQVSMNDYRKIKYWDNALTPQDTIYMHNKFKEALIKWFETPMDGARVVISHHAPVHNPKTKYVKSSELYHAYVCTDMLEIIEKYQPALWCYGHTHECDDQMIGKTRIISNQGGYPGERPEGFCKDGKPVIVG